MNGERTRNACLKAAFKPQKMAERFRAWRLPHGCGETIPLDVAGAETLTEALQASQTQSCHHKDTLLVLAINAHSGRQMLHSYQVRQGKREYRRDPITGIPGWVHPLKLDETYAVAVEAFSPAERWQWSPGADSVGFRPEERGVIDA